MIIFRIGLTKTKYFDKEIYIIVFYLFFVKQLVLKNIKELLFL